VKPKAAAARCSTGMPDLGDRSPRVPGRSALLL
jgi:hypothetical protein